MMERWLDDAISRWPVVDSEGAAAGSSGRTRRVRNFMGAQVEKAGLMETIRDEIVVDAPIERVWRAIEDPVAHAEWHPFVLHIAGEHAPGRIRNCEVVVGGKKGTTEERCLAFVPDKQITWLIEQDSTGFSAMVTDWTSGFTVEPQYPEGIRVRAESTFTPSKFISRLTLPIIRRKFHSTQQAILNGLRNYVEN